MCEPVLPIDVLKELKWKLSALLTTVTEPGSAKRAVAELATQGFRREIDWIVANLEAAGEGKKNCGVRII